MRRGLLLLLAFLIPSVPAGGPPVAAPRELRIAAEPELKQSGLLDRLLPPFEQTHGVRVSLHVRSDKEALELGAAGGADVVWVHAPRLGLQYVNQGFYLGRHLVMYTDYVLAGPPGDPARVKGLKRVVLAFRRIAERKAAFVSRGEAAGSHLLEQDLWEKAGGKPGPPWYIRLDVGQAEALAVAAEKGAYILVDRSSVAELRRAARLQVLLEGLRPLRREYHVMEVNPRLFPSVNHRDARALVEYLLSPAAQELIRTFSADDDGGPVFFPGAGT